MSSLHRFAAQSIPIATRLVSGVLPQRWHPGKRAARALNALAGFPLRTDACFSRAVLQSQWLSSLLRHYAESATPDDLHDFLACRVTESGERAVSSYADEARGVVFASPHYGAYVVGCLAALKWFHHRKKFSVFYDDPRNNPHNHGFDSLFTRIGCEVDIIFNGRRGVVAALKALRKGGCLALMPDVFQNVSDTISVPVLGRLMRVMSGTAFFAIKGDALIVPAYAIPGPGLSVEIVTGSTVDPRRYAGYDEEQAIFLITCELFADIAEKFGNAPEHWVFWENFVSASTPLYGASLDSREDIERLIVRRCRQLPQLLRQMPFLAELDLRQAPGKPRATLQRTP